MFGHSSRIVISTSDMTSSVSAWTALGFEVESQEGAVTRLTDGQILLSLINEPFASPALAYFNSDTDKVGTVALPGDLTVFIHHRPMEEEERPTHEQNPMIGFFDALAVGVPDPAIARTVYEQHGFFVQEEWGGEYPQSDVTDGLNVISLHGIGSKRFLAYSADDLEDLVDAIDLESGVDVAVNRTDDGIPQSVILTTPEGTTILVSEDL